MTCGSKNGVTPVEANLRAVVGHGVGEEHFTELPIGETQSGERRRQEVKTGVARSLDPERDAPVARAVVPGQVGCREASRVQRQADKAGQTQRCKSALGQAVFRKSHTSPSVPKPGPKPT